MEEKYGKNKLSTSRDTSGRLDGEVTDSSTESEDEDDDAVLASEALDAQIEATLNAIRAKDPRVYDEKSTFYTDLVEVGLGSAAGNKPKQKPMYLSDYHRQNLLQGVDVEGEDEQPVTYAQEQDDLRFTIVQELHAAADGSPSSNESRIQSGDLHEDSDDGFLVPKPARPDQTAQKAAPNRIKLDVETADKDPESYLSSFMAARAWLPSGTGPQYQPFESDDDEEDQRAEAFEEAYNMRFEDPQGANEKLMSHARDAAARYSVRKETINSRKKTRDAERAKKEAEKQEREEEKARLRKLQVAEAEEKVRKIKQAAGLRGEVLKEQDWSAMLNEGWDDARWEEEMKKRFGDEYYADHESDGLDESSRSRRKLKKPTWDDDIEIKDLVPDFEAGEEAGQPHFALSDDSASDSAASGAEDIVERRNGVPHGISKAKRSRKSAITRERDEQKKEARKERRLIEKLVDEKLNAEDTITGVGSKKTGRFRYRETSPITFGLTARDIIMASDSQLNQYAGLKKMAAFRDNEKKRKDKKRLGKKARLREWRKETFGSEQGPQKTLADVISNQNTVEEVSPKQAEKKRRKRPKKDRTAKVES